METVRQALRYRLGVPEEELSEEEKKRYQKAAEIYEYRRETRGLSTQFTTEYIFHFIKEWDEARMRIKNACGW
ncbi:MAG: hypothetical protein K2N51_00265 [Lachnospiraceae bacterium]|nr:hypothetical protein [Lachnospiraceae bacterium]